jgi:hypothetical protein
VEGLGKLKPTVAYKRDCSVIGILYDFMVNCDLAVFDEYKPPGCDNAKAAAVRAVGEKICWNTVQYTFSANRGIDERLNIFRKLVEQTH